MGQREIVMIQCFPAQIPPRFAKKKKNIDADASVCARAFFAIRPLSPIKGCDNGGVRPETHDV